MIGVDESGVVVVESGGILTGGGGGVYAGHNNANATGTLTVNNGGIVNVSNILWAANNSADGFININTGGVVNVASHLWWGVSGTAEINISGTITQTDGILGLGTSNASTPSGGEATVNILDGGLLALNNISSSTNLSSIQAGSLIDMQGGTLTVPGDFGQVISNYVDANKIVAYGGPGTVNVLVDEGVETNTIVTATPPVVVLTAVWIPADNTNNTDGLWSDGDNWDGGVVPTAGTAATLDEPGTIPCKLTGLATAASIVADTSGAGGTLIVTNGGDLSVGATSASTIGTDVDGTLVVESGASAVFSGDMFIGLNGGAVGQFTMNGGTVDVDGTFGLGWLGGTGTANIHGGLLTLGATSLVWPSSISGASVLDVAGSGKVLILGDAEFDVLDWIDSGHITANGTTNVFVSYSFDDDETLISAELIPPENTVWNPAANTNNTDGLWTEAANWTEGVPGAPTKAVYNVSNAVDCVVSTTNALTDVFVMGDGGPGGTMVVTNGGILTALGSSWCGIGYDDSATIVVEDGGSLTTGNHLWIGHTATGNGTLIMNGGYLFVGEMFGMAWNYSGGTGTALIKGGTLHLHNLHTDRSITGSSVLDVSGTGLVLIDGDKNDRVASYVAGGFITSGGSSNVIHYYDGDLGQTVISTVAPPTDITDIDVAGGNVTVTYDTFAGQTYHLESTPSLAAPIVWTTVPGTTTNAAGSSVTQTFPESGSADTFYRSVSP